MRREPPRRPRVLIVDDCRFDREQSQRALADLADLELCESGEAALVALERESADLVVSDLTMPGISGVELLETLVRDHAGIDFVLLSGNVSAELSARALRLGAAEVLSKPAPPERLRCSVEGVLRRRLSQENQRLREALDTAEACRALTPCLDSGEVYAISLDLLLKALSRERGLAVFHRTSIPMSDAAAFRGFREAEARRLREILVDDKQVELSRFERIDLIEHGPVHAALEKVRVEAGRMLCVPVTGLEGEAGVIWIFEDGRPFEQDEIERAGVVASHARTSLQNAERYNHAKERAFVDDVTEVYNARYLLQTADNEIRRAERYENLLSVLFIDIDRFKQVNDRYGHLVGSQTLRNLSRLLMECVRGVDTLARYGGDEFTILLVDTDHDEALAIAERIRRGVEAHSFEAGSEGSLRLTLCVGVATYPQHGVERDGLLDAADKAMYRAKSLGRNRVCSADLLGEPPGARG